MPFKTEPMHSKSFQFNTTILPNHSVVSLSCIFALLASHACVLSVGGKLHYKIFRNLIPYCPINLTSAILMKQLPPRTANWTAWFTADD